MQDDGLMQCLTLDSGERERERERERESPSFPHTKDIELRLASHMHIRAFTRYVFGLVKSTSLPMYICIHLTRNNIAVSSLYKKVSLTLQAQGLCDDMYTSKIRYYTSILYMHM